MESGVESTDSRDCESGRPPMTSDERKKADAIASPESVAAREREYDRITHGRYSSVKGQPATHPPDDTITRYVYSARHGLMDYCRGCGELKRVWVGDTVDGDRIRVCATCSLVISRHRGPHFE